MTEPKLGSLEYHAVNERHALSPERGDYWHEMFCPVRVVLAVGADTVTICETTKGAGEGRWTWDFSKTRTIPKSEFGIGLHYCSEAMKHNFVCDVAPRSHREVADCFDELEAV